MKKAPTRKRKGRSKTVSGSVQLVDPRQTKYWTGFIDPKSPTYRNAYQSAIAAGYEEKYALNITSLMPKWLSERIGELNEKKNRDGLFALAERNLREAMELPTKTQAMGAFGPIYKKVGKKKVPVMVHNIGLINQRTGVAEFIAKGLGRKVYGDKSGGGLQLNINVYDAKQLKRVAARIYNDESAGAGTRSGLPDSDEPELRTELAP